MVQNTLILNFTKKLVIKMYSLLAPEIDINKQIVWIPIDTR